MGLRFDVLRAAGALAVVVMAGCSADGGSGAEISSGGGRAFGDGSSSAAPGEPSGSSTGTGTGAGQLTAGTWDDNANYEIFTAYREASTSPSPFEDAEHDAAHERFGGERGAHARLDVALVIDTTGSMADELSYLQAELDSIATRVDAAYPDAETRWALIVYRDQGDEYVTRSFAFAGLEEVRASLRAQSAGGGGDYPEASHAALRDMTNLQWREGEDTARLAFWIADAPHHEEVEAEWAAALRTAAELDVHVHPVASSGVDEGTEHSMRSAAQLTGGRYVFLTDDSGIGNDHLEPTIPCYFVTHLDTAMLRVIDVEMTGERALPSADQIVRRAGDPDASGVCERQDGTTAYAF